MVKNIKSAGLQYLKNSERISSNTAKECLRHRTDKLKRESGTKWILALAMSFYWGCHQKMWPRLREHDISSLKSCRFCGDLLILNVLINEIPLGLLNCLGFCWMQTQSGCQARLATTTSQYSFSTLLSHWTQWIYLLKISLCIKSITYHMLNHYHSLKLHMSQKPLSLNNTIKLMCST